MPFLVVTIEMYFVFLDPDPKTVTSSVAFFLFAVVLFVILGITVIIQILPYLMPVLASFVTAQFF
jgi:hypothetical protein